MRPRAIGFHASHEQFTPDRLLRLVQRAERADFDAAMCSDHWAPFSEAQGQSGFAWSWLGAALASTTSVPFGVVNAPGQRYHPAIIAQRPDGGPSPRRRVRAVAGEHARQRGVDHVAAPAQFASAAKHVGPEDMDAAVRILSDLGRHVEWSRRDFDRGFDAVYLHEVGPGQERFVDAFGRDVLPRLR